MKSFQNIKKFLRSSNKRMDEIQTMSKQIHFNNLTYRYTTPSLAPINFTRFKGPIHVCNDIKNSNSVALEKTEENQKQFKSNFGEISTGNPKYRKEDQLNTIKNIKNLYN